MLSGGEYGTLYVIYDTDEPIGGFQFEITGIDIINVYGGEAGDAGFNLVTGDNTVLGFSLDGSSISGYGTLINIDFEGSGMACLESAIFANSTGYEIPTYVWDCIEISQCFGIGDMNFDLSWNVLDIINLMNCVLSENCGDLSHACAGDINGDGTWNVLDIVTLAMCVLANNCDDL